MTLRNFPVALVTKKLEQAMNGDCTVVITLLSNVPPCTLALAVLAQGAGFAGNPVHVVPTRNRHVAAELYRNFYIKKVSFTGSTVVGKMAAMKVA
ncbi:putative succinate-semialdehyde dehydrogenase [NADP(+)] [Paramyrothecium foliicola]|nr:putative succinate-semialdehyde dehydrogenase [NADP(+)] [Paramyrothecium foliicola]